jgi:hypothetical protein
VFALVVTLLSGASPTFNHYGRLWRGTDDFLRLIAAVGRKCHNPLREVKGGMQFCPNKSISANVKNPSKLDSGFFYHESLSKHFRWIVYYDAKP